MLLRGAAAEIKRPSVTPQTAPHKHSNQPPFCMFQSLVPIILCVLPEATMSAKPCCVSRLSSDVCGDFIVANIEDEYSASLVGSVKSQYTVAVDSTSFYLFSYFHF